MTEEERNQEQNAEEPQMTWRPPEGMPVYGLHRETSPPEMEKPWDFAPPQRESPDWQQQPQAPPAQPAEPMEQWGAQPPVYQQQPPPPEQAMQQPPQPAPAPMELSWLPWPLGPALTPDERYRQLYGDPYQSGEPR